MLPAVTALQLVAVDSKLPKVYIELVELTDLERSEAVPVGEKEQCPLALVRFALVVLNRRLKRLSLACQRIAAVLEPAADVGFRYQSDGGGQRLV